MTRTEIQEYRELQHAGFDLERSTKNAVVPNHGSETSQHFHAKACAVSILLDAGYSTATEVTIRSNICDILAYGNDTRKPICVEVERNCTTEVAQAKRDAFCVGPIRECYVIEGTELSANIHDMRDEIANRLGLD